MSRVKDLSLILNDLKHYGESLIEISDSLREMFSEGAEAEPEPDPKPKEEESKPVTLEEVRAVLAKKTRVSRENTEAIRELLLKHGAARLSEIDPKEYASLLKEAEVIPDA